MLHPMVLYLNNLWCMKFMHGGLNKNTKTYLFDAHAQKSNLFYLSTLLFSPRGINSKNAFLPHPRNQWYIFTKCLPPLRPSDERYKFTSKQRFIFTMHSSPLLKIKGMFSQIALLPCPPNPRYIFPECLPTPPPPHYIITQQ